MLQISTIPICNNFNKISVTIFTFLLTDDMEVTQEPDFDVGELSSTGRQLEVALGGAVQLACPPGK